MSSSFSSPASPSPTLPPSLATQSSTLSASETSSSSPLPAIELDWPTYCGHELKTPVAQLQSLLALLDHGFLPVEQRKWLSLARQSAGHLEHRVQHLLEQTVSSSVPQPLSLGSAIDDSIATPPLGASSESEAHWVDLRSVLTHVFSMAYIQAHSQYGLAFEWHVSPSVPCYVALSECALRQILDNLLGNAFLYTRKGSVSLAVSVESGILRFTVADTGCGIAPEDRDRIFNARVSLPAEASSQPIGTSVSSALRTNRGVGLYLARQYAHTMQGHLTLLPSLPGGIGSTFLLEVPFVPGHVAQGLPAIAPNPEVACQRLDWVFCPNSTVVPSSELLRNPNKPFCIDGRGMSNEAIQEWMNRFAHLLTHRPTVVLVVPDQRWQLCSLMNHPLWQAGRQHYIASHPTDLWAIAGILVLHRRAPADRQQGVLPVTPDPLLFDPSSPTSLVTAQPGGGLLSGQGLMGQRIIYLTPDDCGCADEVVAALSRLGMHTQVCLYPLGPPSPSELLERFQDPDWVCLCTTNMSFEDVQRWIQDPVWKTISTPIMIMDQAGEWQGAGSRFNNIAPGSYIPLASVDQFAQAFASVAFHRAATMVPTPDDSDNASLSIEPASMKWTDNPYHKKDLIAPITILVVEDNSISRLILTYQLESLGHRVISAVGLTHAQDLIRQLNERTEQDLVMLPFPGLVLMDLHLPDGAPVADMVQVLRDSGLPRGVPLVGLTAYARPETIENGIAHGLTLCLSKPVELDQWSTILAQLNLEQSAVLALNLHENTELRAAEISRARPSDRPISWLNLVAMLQHNEMLAREIAQLFLLDTPPLLASIEAAIIHKQWPEVIHQAHQLKGSAVYLHAKLLCHLAYQLENLPKEDPSPHMQSQSLGLYRQIVVEFEACAQFLHPLIADESPSLAA